jgi:hypothetical protein
MSRRPSSLSHPERAPQSARPAVEARPRALTTSAIASAEFCGSVRSSTSASRSDHRLHEPTLTATKHRETSLDMNDADPMSHPATDTHEKSPQNTDDANRVPTTTRKRRTPFRERVRGRVYDPRNRVPCAASDASTPRPAPRRHPSRAERTQVNVGAPRPTLRRRPFDDVTHAPLLSRNPAGAACTYFDRAGRGARTSVQDFCRPEGPRPGPRSRRPDMALEAASWGLTGGSYRPNSLSQPE